MNNQQQPIIGPDGLTIEFVFVTPEIAHEWLGYNTHNRPPRGRKIKSFAADMKAGAWNLNGEAIKFAKDGTLLDGQNRLHAVVQAETPVLMVVWRGLPNETQRTMDSGTPRKFSDVLKLEGESNFVSLASITRAINIWEAGFRRSWAQYTPSNTQLMQTLEKYPSLRQIATQSDHVARGCALPASVIGLCWWLFSQLDDEDTEFFFGRLSDGQNLAKGDAIYELRHAAESSRNNRGERSRVYLTALVIKSWNAYRDGTSINVLYFRQGGANPERYPEPR